MARRKHQFDFKKFSIVQKQSAMKVGTDGVVLGAWAEVANARHMLDIGTGTGLLALMIAQRNAAAHIDAIEIDEPAASEAKFNISQSPWNDRIQVIQERIQIYAQTTRAQYDLIVSNPPFFSAGSASPLHERHQARHDTQLPLKELLEAVDRLLTPSGRFSIVLPAQKGDECLTLAGQKQFFPMRQTAFYPKKNKPIERWLLEFTRSSSTPIKNVLIQYNEHGEWSNDYISLTRDFYLKLPE